MIVLNSEVGFNHYRVENDMTTRAQNQKRHKMKNSGKIEIDEGFYSMGNNDEKV